MLEKGHRESLVLRVGARLCALPLTQVKEAMRPLPVEAVLGAPSYVRGLAIIRRTPVPVVDLAALLRDEDRRSAADTSPAEARFVTVRAADRLIALAVDAVLGVRSLALGSVHELPPLLRDAEKGVVDSIGTLDAELLFVLRSARLVPKGLQGVVESSS